MSLGSLLGDLDRTTGKVDRKQILRAPFPYPGGKSRSAQQIVDLLPYANTYVEPFGGSAAVLLARHSSDLEVFNDRYAGVCCFYRCLRDPGLMNQLCERLELTVHSREDWVWCKSTWEECPEIVERAARWYYMTCYSFGGIGRNFGRTTRGHSAIAGKITESLSRFQAIHNRMRKVQIENLDWEQCMVDYDSHETVFYLDPPYLTTDQNVYALQMDAEAHRMMLSFVFKCKGFVAVSGYSNPMYENCNWDHRHEWDAFVSIKSLGGDGEANRKERLAGLEERGTAKEVLWIKDFGKR